MRRTYQLLPVSSPDKNGLVDKRQFSISLNLAGKKQLKIFEKTNPRYSSGAFKIIVSGGQKAFIAYCSFYNSPTGNIPYVKVISEGENSKLVAISNSETFRIYLVRTDGETYNNVMAYITYYQGISSGFTPVFTEDDLSEAKDCTKY